MVSKVYRWFIERIDTKEINYLWFLFLCVLCYGLLIPFLGFYWDDLPYLYQLNTFGPQGFPHYVASDRPFSAWIFMLTTALFGFNPLGYHIFAFLLRLVTVFLFFKILKEIWPQNTDFAFYSASIFAVYPGFQQQPIALIYCHHFSVLAIFLSSILLMIKSVKSQPKNFLFYFFSIAGTFHMFSIENFTTLELIRPLLLFMIFHRLGLRGRFLFKKTLFVWTPYLIVFCSFLCWRIFIFKFPTYEPGLINSLFSDPILTIVHLLNRIPADFFTVTFQAWFKTFSFPEISSFGQSATFFFWFLVFTSLLLTVIVVEFRSRRTIIEDTSDLKFSHVFWGGVILFSLAGSITWILDLPLQIEFAWDRMTLAYIPSVSIFFGGALTIFKKIRLFPIIIFSILISTAIGSHFENSMNYKRDWEKFQQFHWQLFWRIPSLERKSTLITSEPGVFYYSDNSLTSPLNLMYSDQKSDLLDYLYYFTNVRLGYGLKSFEKNIPISQGYRSFSFSGNTSQMLAVKFSPPSCVQVLDRVFSNSITNPNLSELQVKELRISNLTLIKKEPQKIPFEKLFGSEPEKSWCYYFQKADLARQFGLYSEIVKLGDTAIGNKLLPRSASEWLPFLEGYCWHAQWEKVEFILDEISKSNGNFEQGMCYTLNRIRNNENFPHKENLQEYLKRYNCR